MRKIMIIIVLLTIIPVAYSQCIEPESGMEIKEDTVFCEGTYSVDKIQITKDDVVVDCSNSSLVGNLVSYAFFLKNRQGVTIKNCIIQNYEIGINLEHSVNNIIVDNKISNNKFALSLGSSEPNEFLENDYSENVQDVMAFFIPEPEKTEKPLEEIKEEGLKETIEEIKLTEKEILVKEFKIKNPDLDKETIEKRVNDFLNKYSEFSQENLEIERKFEHRGNVTAVVLSITPKKPLKDVSFYEFIPKCFSLYLTEMEFLDTNYDVIEEDPLIVWQFKTLEEEKIISYSTQKKIPEKCKELFNHLAIAKEPKKNSNFISGLIISLILSLLVLLFFKFKRKSKTSIVPLS